MVGRRSLRDLVPPQGCTGQFECMVGHRSLRDLVPPYAKKESHHEKQKVACVHARRDPGRDHDHRHPYGAVAPRGAGFARVRRRSQCQNNLRQLGLGVQGHVATFGVYPSNGWGYRWIGDPDRGTDKKQPGGWIYNILDYVEQHDLRILGLKQDAQAQQQSLTQLTQSLFPLLHCPTRGAGTLLPAAGNVVPVNANWVASVAKTDYAVNEGDYITNTNGGPATLAQGDSSSYPWVDTSLATGICYLRSEVTPAAIRDGLSNTYMIGEKYVSLGGYDTASDRGYDQSAYSGVDLDLNRWVLDPPCRDSTDIEERNFGSAHPGGCGFVFCDGSVHTIRYDIDPEVHRRLGNRADGLPVQLDSL